MAVVNFVEVENVLSKFRKLNDAFKNGMASTKEIALDCEENDKGSSEVAVLKTSMLKYADMRRDLEQWDEAVRQTVSDFKKYHAKEPENVDIEEIFHNVLAEKQANNKESDLEEDQAVKEFTTEIWNENHAGIYPADNEIDNEMIEGEDIVIAQVVGNKLLCPITKTEMEEPMKNKLCGHCYGRKAIEEHIRRMRHKARCPVVGCVHVVKMEHLEVDKGLLRELKKRHK
eukprot:gene12184-13442_t